MAFIELENKILSDLVVHEADPSVGKSRRVVALGDVNTEFKMGTVVFRAKDAAQKGVTPYDKLNIATAGQVNTDNNEYAIVFGDHYGFNPKFTAPDEDAKGVAFVHDVVLKDAEIIAANNINLDGTHNANYAMLLANLERQGIVVEKTMG